MSANTLKSNIFLFSFICSLFLFGCRGSYVSMSTCDSVSFSLRDSVISCLRSQNFLYNINSYLAKNSVSKFYFNGHSYNLKSNLYFRRDSITVGFIRLSFPPMVVGQFKIEDSLLCIKSQLANLDLNRQLPLYINHFLHPALLGVVPPFYILFGDSNFGNFDFYVLNNDMFKFYRSKGKLFVSFILNNNCTLNSYQLGYESSYLVQNIYEFTSVDSLLIPSVLDLSFKSSGLNDSVYVHLNISNISINGDQIIQYK